VADAIGLIPEAAALEVGADGAKLPFSATALRPHIRLHQGQTHPIAGDTRKDTPRIIDEEPLATPLATPILTSGCTKVRRIRMRHT
jgi:hypothetical protein